VGKITAMPFFIFETIAENSPLLPQTRNRFPAFIRTLLPFFLEFLAKIHYIWHFTKIKAKQGELRWVKIMQIP